MASTKTYLDFVMGQLSELKGISFRPMMGEFVLYCRGKVIGGIYDNRLLLKPTKTALQILSDADIQPMMDLPYDGAKAMIAADIDDRELTCRLIDSISSDLPEPKKRVKDKKSLVSKG